MHKQEVHHTMGSSKVDSDTVLICLKEQHQAEGHPVGRLSLSCYPVSMCRV